MVNNYLSNNQKERDMKKVALVITLLIISIFIMLTGCSKNIETGADEELINETLPESLDTDEDNLSVESTEDKKTETVSCIPK
jgi:hypothetical protein